MTVTIEDVMNYTNAEDFEKDDLLKYLDSAKSYIDLLINNGEIVLSEEDSLKRENSKDMLIRQATVNFYENRDGVGKNPNKNATGFNVLSTYLRPPSM